MKIISPQVLICGFAAVQTVFGAEYDCDTNFCQEWTCDEWCGCFEQNPALEGVFQEPELAERCPATNDETCFCGEAATGPDPTLTLDSTPTAEPTAAPTNPPVPTKSHDKQCKIPLTESECRESIHNSELFGTAKMKFRISINWRHSYPAGCWFSGTNMYFNKAKYNREANKRENKFLGSNRLPSERIGVVCMGEERMEIAPEPANVFINKEGSCKNSLSEEDCKSTAFDNYGVFSTTTNWRHSYPAGCWRSGSNFYFNKAKYNRALNFPSRTATNTKASARINQLCYNDELDEEITPEPANVFINKEGSCKNSLSLEDCKSTAFDHKGYFNTVTNWKHSYPAGCWKSGGNFYFNKAKYNRALNFPSRTATNTKASARINQLCYNDELDEKIVPEISNLYKRTSGVCNTPLTKAECISASFDYKGSFSSATKWRNTYPSGCWVSGRNWYFNLSPDSTKQSTSRIPTYCRGS